MAKEMVCPQCGYVINAGRELRLINSEKQQEASRINGAKGGRKKGTKNKKIK